MQNLQDLLSNMVHAAYPARAPRGVPESSIISAENSLGCQLPEPLRAFYLALGAEADLLRSYHYFRQLHELQCNEEVIHFSTEHTGRWKWAVPSGANVTQDPSVLQAPWQDQQWTPTFKHASIFLTHMTCWQIINALPSAARCETDTGAITAFRSEMEVLSNSLGYGMQSLVDFNRGIFVTVLTGTAEVYVGARDDATIHDLEQRKGIELDWL